MQKTLRIIGIIAISAALLATIIISTMPKSNTAEEVWDVATTMGNINAKNHYIIYSDLACPYCIIFENAIVENEEEFKDYIKKNDILVEIRMSDFLYEYGTHPTAASRLGAIGTYCAKDEGKFWDYYDLAIAATAKEYYTYGMSSDAPNKDEFWQTIAKQAGVSENWETCYKNKTPLRAIVDTAEKTAPLVDGMPYFKFNNYTFSGFNPNGDWDDVKLHLDAGLKKK